MMEDSNSIEISLDKKQLKLLIRSLALANFVRTSYQPDKVNKSTKENKLLRRLLTYAEQLGFGNWATSGPKPKLKDMKEMDFYEDIQVFEALAFWNILGEQLAERDMEENYGDEQHLEMSLGESLNKELDIKDRYMDEFEENGLQNLRLIKPTLN